MRSVCRQSWLALSRQPLSLARSLCTATLEEPAWRHSMPPALSRLWEAVPSSLLLVPRASLSQSVALPVAASESPSTVAAAWLESWGQRVAGWQNDMAALGVSFGLWLIKRTYQPSRIRRNRKFGFLNRLTSKDGRHTINRRRTKGRHKISIA